MNEAVDRIRAATAKGAMIAAHIAWLARRVKKIYLDWP
jgi:hypothetical protein